MSYLVEQCEWRLDRRLTKAERNLVSNEAAPQLAEAREWFLANGMGRSPASQMPRWAEWVAMRLLDPTLNYSDLAGREARHADGTLNADVIKRACRVFAVGAGLSWPPKRTRGPKP